MTEVEVDDFEGFEEALSAIEASPEYAEEGLVAEAQSLIVRAMQDRGLTKAQLADLLAVSRPRVTQMLSPECKNLTLRLLGRTAHALGLDIHLVRSDEVRARKHITGEWCVGKDAWFSVDWHANDIPVDGPVKPLKARDMQASVQLIRTVVHNRIAA